MSHDWQVFGVWFGQVDTEILNNFQVDGGVDTSTSLCIMLLAYLVLQQARLDLLNMAVSQAQPGWSFSTHEKCPMLYHAYPKQ